MFLKFPVPDNYFFTALKDCYDDHHRSNRDILRCYKHIKQLLTPNIQIYAGLDNRLIWRNENVKYEILFTDFLNLKIGQTLCGDVEYLGDHIFKSPWINVDTFYTPNIGITDGKIVIVDNGMILNKLCVQNHTTRYNFIEKMRELFNIPNDYKVDFKISDLEFVSPDGFTHIAMLSEQPIKFFKVYPISPIQTS